MVNELRKDIRNYFASNGAVKNWRNPEEGKYAFHYNNELKILDDNLKINPKWKILDVGTGRGRFAIWFAKKECCDITAVDISKEMLKIEKENAKKSAVIDNIKFLLGDADDLSIVEENSFDVVVCMEVFDHLPDLRNALNKIISKLKLEGLFLFSYVPESSLYWKLNTMNMSGSKIDNQNNCFYTALSEEFIHKLLGESNISIIKIFGVGLLFPLRKFRISLMPEKSCKIESLIKNYYSMPYFAYFVKKCTHIVKICKKKNNLYA